MANRRMFSMQIVDTDAFMDMPLSSQALYFHLGMRADDDGFVSNARRIQKLVGASDDDLKILLMKRFILAFESGVIVIKHWKISNYIQKDRYKPTLYAEEKSTLFIKADGAYTDHQIPGATPCLLPAQIQENSDAQSDVYSLDTDCIRRLGKDRLGEDRIGEVNIYNSTGGDDARARAREEVQEFLRGRGNDPSVFFGVTDEIMQTAELFAVSLFKQFTTRCPTSNDIANVFFSIWQSEKSDAGEIRIIFPQDRKDLLMYAFEQATNAGRPGEWNYINGVLKRLHIRGITTLSEAEDYDERN